MQFLNAFLVLLTLCATIVYKTHGTVEMLYVASAAVLIFLALTWKKISRAGKIFIVINIAMLGVFWGRGVDLALVEHGLGRITLFAAFMVGLIFLRVAAKKSRIISRCGSFLINQKPGARYAVLSYGSCLLGAILSFGALNLMGQVIANGNTLEAAKGEERIYAIRLRRMVLAMLRGFATLPLSSPFSISMALVLSVIPSLRWQSLIPLTIVFAVVLIALGWLMDSWAYPKPALQSGARKYDNHWGGVVSFIFIVLGLFGLSAMISITFDYGLPTSIMMLSPFFALGWFVIEFGLTGMSLKKAASFFFSSLKDELNGMSSEIAIIGGASFAGALVAAIIPTDLVQTFSETLGISGFALAVFCILAVALISVVGVSPFVSVTILASTFADVEVFGLSPYVLALSLLTGWALALNFSPLTISTIIIGRILNCRASDVTLNWNRNYCLVALGAVIAILYVFHIMYD